MGKAPTSVRCCILSFSAAMSAAGTVARLRASFEGPQLPGLGDSDAATLASAPASQQRKRLKLWSGCPPVPSPREGAESAEGVPAGEGLAARRLWPEDQREGDETCATAECSLPQDEPARVARLEQIRAK